MQLVELFHAKTTIYSKYKKMFREEPPKKVKEFFDKIEKPYPLLKEIFEIIQYITRIMKENLDEKHHWQT